MTHIKLMAIYLKTLKNKTTRVSLENLKTGTVKLIVKGYCMLVRGRVRPDERCQRLERVVEDLSARVNAKAEPVANFIFKPFNG